MADIDNPRRRLLGHLATPRTLTGLTERLHADPYVGLVDVGPLLEEVVEEGLVANLGGDTPEGIVTAASAKSSKTIGFGSGQAKVWQQRAEAGLYDSEGDFYMLTQDGLQALKGGDSE